MPMDSYPCFPAAGHSDTLTVLVKSRPSDCDSPVQTPDFQPRLYGSCLLNSPVNFDCIPPESLIWNTFHREFFVHYIMRSDGVGVSRTHSRETDKSNSKAIKREEKSS